jgi:ABC-type glycerol-3-phosphate transport system permease component
MKENLRIIITSLGLWFCLGIVFVPLANLMASSLNKEAARYVTGRRSSINTPTLDRYYEQRMEFLKIGLLSSLVISQTATVLIFRKQD